MTDGTEFLESAGRRVSRATAIMGLPKGLGQTRNEQIPELRTAAYVTAIGKIARS